MLRIFCLLTLATWTLGIGWPMRWIFWVLVICWLAYGIASVIRIWFAGQAWLLLAPAILIVILGIGIAIPGETMTRWLLPINEGLVSLHRQHPNWPLLDLSAGKIGHIVCFAAISFSIFVFRKRLPFTVTQMAWVLILLALATEGMQLFIHSRGTSGFDIGLDAIGMMLGIVMGAAFVTLGRRLKTSECWKSLA